MSKIIQSLKNEGALVLYHDYRAFDFQDRSGSGNHGTPTGTIFTRRGCQFISSAKITVTDDASIKLTEGTLIAYFADGIPAALTGDDRLFSKRNAGVNYELRFDTTPQIEFYDGSNVRNLAVSPIGSKYLGVNFSTGATPEGFLDGSSAGNFDDTVTVTATSDSLYIGNTVGGSRPIQGLLSSALIVNRELTATEHSRLYSELSNLTWPSRPYILSRASLDVDSGETGLVAGWNMRPAAGKIVDVTANGNDGTIVGATQANTPFGSALWFDGVNDVGDCGNDASLNATTGITLSGWIRADSLTHAGGSNAARIFGKNGSYNMYVSNTGTLVCQFTGLSDTTINAATAIGLGQWYYVVATYSQATGDKRIYINGVLDNTEGGTTGTITVTANNLFIGNLTAAILRFWNGCIAYPKVYSVAKDQAWVTDDYNRGNTALFKTEYGAYESDAAVTAGHLENTPFIVNSGSFKISRDTIEGKTCKVIECVTAGLVYIPISCFHQTPIEAAYGEWKWWLNKGSTSNEINVLFVADVIGARGAAGQDAYIMRYPSTERFVFGESTAGAYADLSLSAAGYLSESGTWHSIKFTRSNDGAFTFYADNTLVDVSGGSGTNPTTDTTITSSRYIVFDLDAGDKVGYSDISGNHSIIKRVLA
jgi:hypothetical protein